MLVIIIILYPFAYNKQQTQNTTTHNKKNVNIFKIILLKQKTGANNV